MVRIILGAIVGWIVNMVFIFSSFTVLYVILGTDGSFQPERFTVSLTWTVLSFVLGFVGTIIGGFVAVLIGKSQKAALGTAGLILAVSLVAAFVAMGLDANEVRTSDIDSMVAMTKAINPTWFNFLVPFTGFIGAIIGGRLKKTDE